MLFYFFFKMFLSDLYCFYYIYVKRFGGSSYDSHLPISQELINSPFNSIKTKFQLTYYLA